MNSGGEPLVRKYDIIKLAREHGIPLLTMDFWNDGEYVNVCIAGGKNYLHINANGDVESCAFIHYSIANIKEVSLIEAMDRDNVVDFTNKTIEASKEWAPVAEELLEKSHSCMTCNNCK